MTDEKLSECSAESTGVYIRIMCLMHKSEEYGKILLKQKFKQNSSTCLNFACKLAYHLPYSVGVIESALVELTENGVLSIEGDELIQKRMVRDFYLSNTRAEAGKKGGKKTGFCLSKKRSKTQANTEYEYINENEYETDNKLDTKVESIPYKTIVDFLNLKTGSAYKHTSQKTKDLINARFNEGFKEEDFISVITKKTKEWADTDMQKFLRPETLFSNKFEGYVNQKEGKKVGNKTANVANFDQRTYEDDYLKSMEEDVSKFTRKEPV